MRTTLLILLSAALSPLLAAAAKNCGCECCKGKEACCCVSATAVASSDGEKRHPLRGIVTAVLPDRAALMVKHEEIPGVMRAMTMLFKVDAATLKSVQKGQAITGMM